MSDRILQRYTARNGEAAVDEPGLGDVEGTDDLGAFGWLRGIRDRALSLELRKKTGNIVAIGYGWIEKFEFDPSDGITLHLAGQKVRIKGRNLNGEVRPTVRLFQGIVRHRVPWIQEADEPRQIKAGKDATVVEVIEC